MAFTDPSTVHIPTATGAGSIAPVAWGTVVNDDLNDVHGRFVATLRRVNGTLDASGGGTFAHGMSVAGGSVLVAYASYKGNSGEAVPLPAPTVDGSNVYMVNTAAAANKSFVVGLIVADTAAAVW